MGAHSAAGHVPARTVTAAAGLAAALVTTATTGVLVGGTALASEGSGGSGSHGGSGHSHGHDGSRGDDDYSEQAADPGLAGQTLCDVFGDIDLGGDSSCSTGDDGSGSSSGDDDGFPALGALGQQADPSRAAGSPASPAPAAPAPKPKPTSSVPDHPTVQPIVAPSAAGTAPANKQVVPIAAAG